MKSFLKNEAGQSLVEYALVIALIASVLIVALTMIGNNISDHIFNTVAENINEISE